MYLLGQTFLGIAILLLLGALVVVKRISTGAILDKPQGGFFLRVVNIFNLFFLLIVNPLAAVGLIARALPGLDPAHISMQAGWFLSFVEVVGLLLYVSGFALMAWALLTLSRYYQLGGTTPRPDDRMVVEGPYRLIRHPMYAAALSIALGLSLLIQSLAFFAVFVIYVALMFGLIPLEERELKKAYGASYEDYRRKTKMLIPAIY